MRNIEFVENYGVKLAKDFGDLRKGELFYVKKKIDRTVYLIKQEDKNYHLELPLPVAKKIFLLM